MPNYNSNGPTPAPVTTWTDDPLSTSVPVKAVHTTEIRSCITSLKAHTHNFPRNGSYGATPVTSQASVSVPSDAWTDPTLIPNVTPEKAVHPNEIITALKVLDGHNHLIINYNSGFRNVNGAVPSNRTSTNYAAGYTWLKDPLVAGVDSPRVDVYEQLRTYMEALAIHIHTACCECECTCTCECETTECCCSECDCGD